MKTPSQKPHSCPRSDFSLMAKSFALSLLIHGAILTVVKKDFDKHCFPAAPQESLKTETKTELFDNPEDIPFVLAQKLKMTFNQSSNFEPYKNKLRAALESNENIPDLGTFYLDMELLSGLFTPQEHATASATFDSWSAQLIASKQTKTPQEVLIDILENQGDYNKPRSTVTTLLNKEGGNCSARAKTFASLIQRVYPDLLIQFQHIKIDGGAHIRTLVQVEGTWYAMDGALIPLQPEDMAQTVLFKPDAHLRLAAELPVEGKFIQELSKPLISTSANISFTDDILSLPNPVSFDLVKNEETKSSQLSRQGFASGGSNRNANALGMNSGYGSFHDPNPMRITLITDKELKKIEQRFEMQRTVFLEMFKPMIGTLSPETILNSLSQDYPSLDPNVKPILIQTLWIMHLAFSDTAIQVEANTIQIHQIESFSSSAFKKRAKNLNLDDKFFHDLSPKNKEDFELFLNKSFLKILATPPFRHIVIENIEDDFILLFLAEEAARRVP